MALREQAITLYANEAVPGIPVHFGRLLPDP
eukprot:SAG31_NODE_2917_length_4915_cov_1.456603_5_plen_30_part_01